MSKTQDKVLKIIALLEQGISPEEIKKQYIADEQEWHRVSKKIYALYIDSARRENKAREKERNVSFTKNHEISAIIELNQNLSDYALGLPHKATMHDFHQLNDILKTKPVNETELIKKIESVVMPPNIRAYLQKGRFECYDIFKKLSSFIESATICYYRKNYHSAFLTLVPVIEGAMLRWMGYRSDETKPTFDDLRKFFRNGHSRQPCPGNPLFYDVFAKVCDRILSEHLYKPSFKGSAYSNFNRHLAVHLLSDDKFATKENCIRLFLLVDIMSELYHYETSCPDPWFSLDGPAVIPTINAYNKILLENYLGDTPEITLLCK